MKTSIEKIRIVNLNYNSDHNRINDITITLKGKDTLLSMANATGKTTMIHAILAGLMHRRKVTYKSGNTRGSMKSFLSSKMSRPTVVMLEWNVNDLTVIHGYVAKMIRSQDEEKGMDIDMSYFVLVVDNNSQIIPFDVESIAVTDQDENGSLVKSSQEIKKLFSKYAKDPEFESFDVYNANNNANAYFDKLKSLGIPSYEVWEEIVKKVNSSESNLSDFFQDSHTSLSLMRDFILPKVEKKLKSRLDAGGEKTIEALQVETRDYIEQYKDHQKEIKTQEIVNHCKQLLEDLMPDAKNYVERFNNAKQSSGQMLYISEGIHHKIDRLESDSKEAEHQSEEIKTQITYENYAKYSALYYRYEREYHEYMDKSDALTEKIASIEKLIEDNKREISLLQVAESYERYSQASRELETVKTENENILKDVASLKEQANYLGSCLKDYYAKRKDALEQELNDYKATIIKCNDDIKAHQERLTNIEESQMNAVVKRAEAKAAASQFVERVDHFNKRDVVTLTQNVFDMYDDEQFDAVKDQLEKITEVLNDNKAQLEALLSQIEEAKTLNLEETRQCELELQEDRYEYKSLLEKLNDMKTIVLLRLNLLKYIEKDESSLFNKDAIIEAFTAKINGFKEDIRVNTEKKNELEQERNALLTGQSFRVSDSVKKALKRMQINALYGTQFLKENTFYTDEQKMEFVKKHPMLPYSIVVQKEDLERIKRRIDVFVDEPVSFFAREDITSDGDGAQWMAGDGSSGLTYFHQNEKLFSKEWVDSQMQILDEKIKQITDQIKEAKDNEAFFTDSLNSLKYSKDLTEEDYNDTKRQITKIEAKIKEDENTLTSLKEDLAKIEQDLSDSKEELSDNQKKREVHRELTREFMDLYHHKDEYARNLKEVHELENQIDTLTKQKEKAHAFIEQNEALRNKTQDQINTLQPDVLEVKSNYNKYVHYTNTSCPEGYDAPSDYETMKGQLDGLERLINQRTSGADEELKKANKRYHKEKATFEEVRNRFTRKYESENEEWKTIRYDRKRLDTLEDENESLDQDFKSYNHELRQVSNDSTKAKNDQDHAIARIHELGYSDVLDEHKIIKEDYDEVIQIFEQELAKCMKEVQKLTKESLAFEKVGMKVNQYLNDDVFMKHQITTPIALEENLDDCDVKEIERMSQRVYATYVDQIKAAIENKKKLLHACDENRAIEPQVGTGYFTVIKEEISQVFSDQENEKHHKYADVIVDTIEEAINRVDERLENARHQLASVMAAKHTLTDNLLRYCDEVHKEIKKIDRNSLMTLRDDEPEKKMFEIVLPSSHSNMELKDRPERPLVTEYLDEMTERCLQTDTMSKEEQKSYIDQRINTQNLFAHVYCRDRFGIKVIKIDNDQMRGQTLAWEDAPASGAQGALISFTIIVCMMNYLSLDESEKLVKNRSKGSVIFIDNPYGELSTEPYLTIFSKMAKNNNIQIISFSALTDQSITNKFDVLYTLKLFETRNGKNLLKLYEGLDQLPPLDETTNILENEYLKVE